MCNIGLHKTLHSYSLGRDDTDITGFTNAAVWNYLRRMIDFMKGPKTSLFGLKILGFSIVLLQGACRRYPWPLELWYHKCVAIQVKPKILS